MQLNTGNNENCSIKFNSSIILIMKLLLWHRCQNHQRIRLYYVSCLSSITLCWSDTITCASPRRCVRIAPLLCARSGRRGWGNVWAPPPCPSWRGWADPRGCWLARWPCAAGCTPGTPLRRCSLLPAPGSPGATKITKRIKKLFFNPCLAE